MKLFEKQDIESGTRTRIYNFYVCDCCGKEYRKQKRQAEGSPREHYCSQTCFYDSSGQDRIELECAHCKKLFTRAKSKLKNSKHKKYFCCRDHKDQAQKYMKEIQPDHYGTGKEYRNKALSYYGSVCSICGFDNILAIEVHHKDRDRNNNSIDNLEVLCANCHSIEHRS